MAVRIRMKKLGRKHRAFFRICAMDSRSPRDGRVLEELGTYDPSIPDTNARTVLKRDRVDYWIGVGAQPTEKVGVLIKKYGTDGTHLDVQKAAMDKMAQPMPLPDPGVPASMPKSKEEPKEESSPAPEAPATEAPATEEAKTDAAKETATAEAPAAEKAATEAPAEEAKKETKE